MSDKDVPVITAQFTGRAPCPICERATNPGDRIAKRWGNWVHESCFQAMTPKERWEFTQQRNARTPRQPRVSR